jgi:hypothetical protein
MTLVPIVIGLGLEPADRMYDNRAAPALHHHPGELAIRDLAAEVATSTELEVEASSLPRAFSVTISMTTSFEVWLQNLS